MKTRFDGIDVTAMVAHVQAVLLDRRVLNVYDGGDSETYIIKVDKGVEDVDAMNTAGNDASSRGFILIESGKRFHPLNHFHSEASVMPSPFAAKLRKHLKGLRLSRVFQVGRDRVVVFSFSSFHLILELYDRGNLILCDASYSILALLRSHLYAKKKTMSAERHVCSKEGADTSAESDNAVAVSVGHVYPVSYATNLTSELDLVGMLSDDCSSWVRQQLVSESQKKKKKQALTLKSLVLKSTSGVSHYGPALLEHCILTAGLDPYKALIDEQELESIPWESLRSALLGEGQHVLENFKKTTAKGYIRYTESIGVCADGESAPSPQKCKVFQEYLPYLFHQHSKALILPYDTFGDAVQDFYQQLATQKAAQRQSQLERAAHDKLLKIRQDQEARVGALQQEQELLQHQAQMVQQHASSVDAALTVVNSALNSGMNWDQLAQLIQVEQRAGNPIASLIHELDLKNDAMIMSLPLFDDESERLRVTVSLKESAHANANILFAKYRAAKEKSAKTLDSMSLALKAAEENAKRYVESAQKRIRSNNAASAAAAGQRKPSWFEKFHWFITSDNYLVLGGKDAHQNELLVKRYLRPGDAYLHADVFGSTSTILRSKRQRGRDGKTKPLPLSEQALREAGSFTICRSSAWTSRMITSAWWVEAHQVSKTAPTGEYLTVGSFMVRGKKNFLPPTPLEMGIAILFRLGNEASIARHKNDRRDFALIQFLEDDDEDEHSPEEVVHSPNVVEESLTVSNAIPLCVEDTVVNQTIVDSVLPGGADTSVASEALTADQRDDPSGEPAEEPFKKKGLSARDRKLVKRYGSLEEVQRRHGSRDEKEDLQVNVKLRDGPYLSESSSVGGGMKRGQKGKMKKIKEKYSDQDAEDRELAMLALQGGEKSKKRRNHVRDPTKNQRHVALETSTLLKRDPSSAARQLPKEVQSILAECIQVYRGDESSPETRWEKFDADTLFQLGSLEPLEAQIAAANRLRSLKAQKRIDNFSASLGGILRAIRKYGHEGFNGDRGPDSDKAKRKTKEEKKVEAERLKGTLVEEGHVDSEGDDGAVDDTIELNKLTGKPQLEDTLVYAVPVCAPYQTLSQYTYRVKLTPGNMKRGKAVKQCLEILANIDGLKALPLNQRCVDLFKKINENDWIQTICPDVKISAPGASKAAKHQKAKNKAKK
jgi:predicted ribosome quality control (RQC) complex YloA/Tae2 family protein